MEHRHEVALTGAEAPVQVGGLAAVRLHGALDEIERRIEALAELGRHHVGLQRLLRVLDTLGELQDEVPAVHLLGEVD